MAADDSPSDTQEAHEAREARLALVEEHVRYENEHGIDDHVVLETITGTHTGPWRGLPGTGRHVEFPVCTIFPFDDGGNSRASVSITTGCSRRSRTR